MINTKYHIIAFGPLLHMKTRIFKHPHVLLVILDRSSLNLSVHNSLHTEASKLIKKKMLLDLCRFSKNVEISESVGQGRLCYIKSM